MTAGLRHRPGMLFALALPGLYSMMTADTRGVTYGAGDPETPVKKAWPLMTPAERLAIWEDARLAWTHDAAIEGDSYRLMATFGEEFGCRAT